MWVSRTRPGAVDATSPAIAGASRCIAPAGTGPRPNDASTSSVSPGRISGPRSSARPQSPGVDEARAVRRREADRVAVVGVGDAPRFEAEIADSNGVAAMRLEVQRGRGEPGLGMERVEAAGEAGRRDDPHPASRLELVA